MNTLETTLCLAGDVMTGRGIDQVLPHRGSPELHEHSGLHADDYVRRAEALNGRIEAPLDFSAIWGDASHEWDKRDADYRIVNLETSITTSDAYWHDKTIHYRMHPNNAPCLVAAGFDCCVVANNHVMDWGHAGLIETLQTLKHLGLQAVGAGANNREASEPAVLQQKGKGRVLVFAWTHPSSYTPTSWAATVDRPGVSLLENYTPTTITTIKQQIAAVKRENDVVVASLHWGPNWGYEVGVRQRWFAHRLIDTAGVHVVHGHSSHHPMGVEVYRNQPILYGCGDFMNDYEGIATHATYRPDLSTMYFVSLKLPSRRLASLTLVPMQLRGFQLRSATGADARWLCETLNRGGIAVSTQAKLRRWARLRRTRFNCRWEIQSDNSLRIVR